MFHSYAYGLIIVTIFMKFSYLTLSFECFVKWQQFSTRWKLSRQIIQQNVNYDFEQITSFDQLKLIIPRKRWTSKLRTLISHVMISKIAYLMVLMIGVSKLYQKSFSYQMFGWSYHIRLHKTHSFYWNNCGLSVIFSSLLT